MFCFKYNIKGEITTLEIWTSIRPSFKYFFYHNIDSSNYDIFKLSKQTRLAFLLSTNVSKNVLNLYTLMFGVRHQLILIIISNILLYLLMITLTLLGFIF
jgi:hypothetical protein